MDSHLNPNEMGHVVADNRRKIALQRLRNPFIEPFVSVSICLPACPLACSYLEVKKEACMACTI